MKKRVFYLLAFIFILIYILPIKVVADSNMQLSLSCNSTTDQTNNISCDITANTNDKKINNISFKYVIDSSIKFTNFNSNVGTPNVNGTTIKINTNSLSGNNIKIGTLKFKSIGGSSGTKVIKLQSINYTDIDNKYYTHSQISDSAYITLSTKKEITNLNISSGTLSPAFNKYTYNYQIKNYKEDSIVINAEHNGSSISGVGTHNLSLGDNVIKLVVTAQNGSGRTYKITVNKIDSRNSDTTLANIKINSGELNFNPKTRQYNVNVTSSKINFDIEKNISSQKVEFSPDKTVELQMEEKKTVTIKVTAENGDSDSYTFDVKRIQSTDPSLNFKTFKINGNDFELNEDNNTYNISVANSVEKLNFEYELEDKESKVDISGNENLAEGTNEIILTVTNSKGEDKKYTFWVNRKGEVDVLENDLEQIILELEGNKDKIYVAIKDSDDSDENKIIYKDVLNKLSKTDKTLTYEVLNENEGVIYSIILNNIEDIEYTEDIDINLDMTSTNGDVKALVNKKDFIYIKENQIKLPIGSKIKVFGGDVFKNNTKLYLYKYDEKLELLENDIKVKNGFITFDADDLSNLVITDYNINKKVVVTDKIQNKKTNRPNKLFVGISLAVEFITIIVLLVYVFINNMKIKKMDI